MTPPKTPHLVLGGAKSGKSALAERFITAFPPPYVYIATGQALDGEMERRIALHRERRGPEWRTMECPLELEAALDSLRGSREPVLVDCLTLWITNLLLSETHDPEDAIRRLVSLVPTLDFPLVLVSNEVGAGIVPENALARAFRDLAGAANQRLAAVCSGVSYVVAGLPITLK